MTSTPLVLPVRPYGPPFVQLSDFIRMMADKCPGHYTYV